MKHLLDLGEVLETCHYTLAHEHDEAAATARNLLSDFGDSVGHAVFDPNKPLETQELKDQKFDIVIAFDFANSTANPDVALDNFKKVLNEGGEILAVEVTNPGLYLSMLSETIEPRYVTRFGRQGEQILTGDCAVGTSISAL